MAQRSGSFVYSSKQVSIEEPEKNGGKKPKKEEKHKKKAGGKKASEGRVVRGTKGLFWCALIKIDYYLNCST